MSEPLDDGPARADLAALFEGERRRLRGLAFRLLGSLADADDVVQDAWLRLSRAAGDAERPAVADLPAWLTTVTARLALDALRSRRRRAEESLEAGTGATPQALRSPQAPPARDAEEQVILAEQVGIALLVVLERLAPAERLAFVLHDVFGLPFEAIAPVLGRSPAATRQVASRARRRVRAAPTGLTPASGRPARALVEAFADAAQRSDVAALIRLLDPEVTLTLDPALLPPGAPAELRGAKTVAGRASFGAMGRSGQVVMIDGKAGLAVAPSGRLDMVMTFAVAQGRIARIEIIADPARLAALSLALAVDP